MVCTWAGFCQGKPLLPGLFASGPTPAVAAVGWAHTVVLQRSSPTTPMHIPVSHHNKLGVFAGLRRLCLSLGSACEPTAAAGSAANQGQQEACKHATARHGAGLQSEWIARSELVREHPLLGSAGHMPAVGVQAASKARVCTWRRYSSQRAVPVQWSRPARLAGIWVGAAQCSALSLM